MTRRAGTAGVGTDAAAAHDSARTTVVGIGAGILTRSTAANFLRDAAARGVVAQSWTEVVGATTGATTVWAVARIVIAAIQCVARVIAAGGATHVVRAQVAIIAAERDAASAATLLGDEAGGGANASALFAPRGLAWIGGARRRVADGVLTAARRIAHATKPRCTERALCRVLASGSATRVLGATDAVVATKRHAAIRAALFAEAARRAYDACAIHTDGFGTWDVGGAPGGVAAAAATVDGGA